MLASNDVTAGASRSLVRLDGPRLEVVERSLADRFVTQPAPADPVRHRRPPRPRGRRHDGMPGQELLGRSPHRLRQRPLPGRGQPLDVAIERVRKLDLHLDHAIIIRLHGEVMGGVVLRIPMS